MLFGKIKILNSYGVSMDRMKEIVLETPQIFLKSVGSLNLKMKWL